MEPFSGGKYKLLYLLKCITQKSNTTMIGSTKIDIEQKKPVQYNELFPSPKHQAKLNSNEIGIKAQTKWFSKKKIPKFSVLVNRTNLSKGIRVHTNI